MWVAVIISYGEQVSLIQGVGLSSIAKVKQLSRSHFGRLSVFQPNRLNRNSYTLFWPKVEVTINMVGNGQVERIMKSLK